MLVKTSVFNTNNTIFYYHGCGLSCLQDETGADASDTIAALRRV